MIPIICFVGASNSGKTTVLERLIPELNRRGYVIGAIKHDAHSFEMDREGKDTWRHREAGARTIAISSPAQVASIRRVNSEMALEEVVGRYFWQEDLIVAEGFKRLRFPKIEVFRSVIEPNPICGPGDNRIAMVSDDPVRGEVPVFGFRETDRLADFLEDRYLKGRKRMDALVRLDGKQLPMNDFVRDFLIGGVRGMLSTLRGWDSPRTIDIQIRLEDE